MRLVIPNTKLLLDHYAHAGAGPDLPAKTVGFGSLAQDRQQRLMLDRRQSRGTPGVRPGQQGIGTRHFCGFDPLAYGSFADSKPLGNLLLAPVLLQQFQRTQSPRLSPVGEQTLYPHSILFSCWTTSATSLGNCATVYNC